MLTTLGHQQCLMWGTEKSLQKQVILDDNKKARGAHMFFVALVVDKNNAKFASP